MCSCNIFSRVPYDLMLRPRLTFLCFGCNILMLSILYFYYAFIMCDVNIFVKYVAMMARLVDIIIGYFMVQEVDVWIPIFFLKCFVCNYYYIKIRYDV
jgi:hypothetical protein